MAININGLEAEEAFLTNFKVALAAAIVRSKPKEISGLEYATILAQKISNSEETWKNKAENLQKKLLETKQQNVFLRLKYEVQSNDNFQRIDKEAISCALVESKQETSSIKWKEDQVSEHVQFLKTVAALKWREKSNCAQIDNDDVIKASIRECIKGMTRSVKMLKLNGKILTALEESGEVLNGLLKEDDLQQDLDMQENFLNLLEELIRTIMNQKAAAFYETQDRLSKMVAKLGSIPLVVESVIAKMGILIKTYSELLADHQKNGSLIQADKFENICYVLRIMEQILINPKTSSKALLKAKESICDLMQQNMFRLTNTFPMFVHYVWKLTAIIETQGMPKESEENIWRQQKSS